MDDYDDRLAEDVAMKLGWEPAEDDKVWVKLVSGDDSRPWLRGVVLNASSVHPGRFSVGILGERLISTVYRKGSSLRPRVGSRTER